MIQSTIVIPTFNRVAHLDKCLHHLVVEFARAPVAIMILDGSSDENADCNRALCRELNVPYQHYPSSISMMQRIDDGMQRVKTPFVSIMADDDILFAAGYIESLAFLRMSDDYAAAHGSYIERIVRGNCPSERQIYTNPCPTHADSWLERSYDYLSNYLPVSYAVHRTSVLQNSFALTPETIDPQDYTLMELFLAIQTVMDGKVQKFDIPFCSRIRQGNVYVPGWQLIHQPQFSVRYQRVKHALIHRYRNRVRTEDGLGVAIDMIFNCFWGKTDHNSKARFLEAISGLEV